VNAEDDARFMALALALGGRGLGRVWPNPAVGCVIVGEGRIVGRGWTQPGGRPHAETVALGQAGGLARGATAYVTLEPCSHHGKTPPCADALVAAGVARVVTALTDPDPRVSGRGHAMLRAAGIAVTEGIGAAEARAAQQGFLSRVTAGRPMVTLKLAMTLDGRIATAGGESRWITGAVARRHVHAQRMAHDAVMVGVGTALADDPDLTVREMGAAAQPVRVVLDSRLRLPVDSRLGRTAREAPVWLVHGADADAGARRAWEAAGTRLLPCEIGGAGRIGIGAALAALGTAGLTRVYAEGGATVAAALIENGLADRLHVYSAGRVFGAGGMAAVAGLGNRALAEMPRYRLEAVRDLGGDVLHMWERDGAA